VKLRAEFKFLKSVPGIGQILALALMLETGISGDLPVWGELRLVLSVCRESEVKQRQTQRQRQHQEREQVSELGVCRGGQLCDPV